MTLQKTSLPESRWAQLQADYIAGAGLRALARREVGIAEGTTAAFVAVIMLARSAREGWSTLKRQGKATAQAAQCRSAASTTEAVANETAGRAERHIERMSRLCESVGGHVETLPPGRLIESISRLNCLGPLGEAHARAGCRRQQASRYRPVWRCRLMCR